MIQDLHSHTYYSFCGKDKPEQVIEAAIAGGIELLGITDHNHGIANARMDFFNLPLDGVDENYGRTLERYFDHINLLKEKYADRIKILRGIEATTHTIYTRHTLAPSADVSFFDFCLVENLDHETSLTGGDLFAYAKRLKCPTGIAHTDMFAFIEKIGADPYDYFLRMAEEGIFWEMNVNYDSIHKWREHKYVLDFFADEKKQEIVRRSGVRLSVGFDGHDVKDYLPKRIADSCKKIEDMGIKLAFAP